MLYESLFFLDFEFPSKCNEEALEDLSWVILSQLGARKIMVPYTALQEGKIHYKKLVAQEKECQIHHLKLWRQII